jgi:hypothetical protein
VEFIRFTYASEPSLVAIKVQQLHFPAATARLG